MQGQSPLSARRAAVEGGFDGLAGACEDGEDAVAEELAFDGGARVLADDSAEGGVQVAGLRAEGGVAEALGEGGRVGDVGEEDDGGARGEPGHRAGFLWVGPSTSKKVINGGKDRLHVPD